jgi:hypothetical protein
MHRRAFLTAATAGVCAPVLARAQSTGPAVETTPPGLVGELHRPDGAGRAPGLLILGGSEGGHGPAFHFAATFAKRGFASLGLAYFGDPGLPKTLENVPLEYFTKAIDWLVAQPGVDPKRIGVFGGSKGAEAALLIAARDPRIKAVVAGVPSSVAWQGYNPANPINPGPSWTSGGRPVPYVHYDESATFTSVLDLYQRSLAKAPADAAIPVERINGPVLLVSARDDRIWPSAAMGEQVMTRLDKAHFRFGHTHLAYDNAGHAGFGEALPPGTTVPPAMLAQLGGTAEGNLAMRADAWPKILAFLDKALQPQRKA